jgi:DNA repair protein RecO (recombination protein O)
MIEKDLGFVIKRNNFRETSIIANIYTLRFGKITGIFKGFYPFRKEFSTSLDVFTLNEFIFYPKRREIWLISFADLIYDYPYLREDFSRSKMAALFLNLVDRTMHHWDSNPAIFYLLKECLDFLAGEREYKALYIFLIKFLTISGFKPEFNRCIICHNDLEDDIFFSVSKGGLVCANCYRKAADYQKISKETSATLFYVQKTDFAKVNRINPTYACEKEMLYLLREFLLYHLDFDILPKLKKERYEKTIFAGTKNIVGANGCWPNIK